jgi:hypothetical protein
MKNKSFLFVLVVSLLLIVSLSGVLYAAQQAVRSTAGAIKPAQPTSVTTKPLQQPVAVQNSSLQACANVCEKGMMIQKKMVSGNCKEVSTSSCFPYTCNYQGTLCHDSCTGNVQCATPNAYCKQATKQCLAGNNCPSKCEIDNKVEYIPTSMMPNSDTCKKDKTTSCFPYSCDPQSGACRYNCTSDQQCATGAMCNVASKSCVPAVAHCDKDHRNILVLPDSTKIACDPYMCKGNVCLTNCDSAEDCVAVYIDGKPDTSKTFVCDTTTGRICVPMQ